MRTTHRSAGRRLAATTVALVAATGSLVAAGTGSAAAVPATIAGSGFTEVSVPGVVHVLDAVTVPGDATYLARGSEVDRFVPGSPLQQFTLPSGSNARHLAVDGSGHVWFGGFGGSLGTITPTGTVTTKALAAPTSDVASLAWSGNDLWVLAGSAGSEQLELAPAGGTLAQVTIPALAGYQTVVSSAAGGVVLIGNQVDRIDAAGDTFAISGGLGGTLYDAARRGDDVWYASTNGLTEIVGGQEGHVVTYPTAGLDGGTPLAVSTDSGTPHYLAGGDQSGAPNLGRLDGPTTSHATVIADTPPATESFLGTILVPGPDGKELWAIGTRSSEVRLVPLDVTDSPSTVTVSALPALTAGLPFTATATIAPWDGSTPTGSVSFNADGVILATAPVQTDGTASTTIDPSFTGLTVRATYSGDGTHVPAYSEAVHAIVASSSTTTTITGPPKPWRPGNLVFHVTVSTTTGAVPSGTVHVGALMVPISSAAPTAFTVFSPGGTVSLNASFDPDGGFLASTASLPSAVTSWDTPEENYVSAAYLRLFNRLPDPSGRTYWAGKIRNGTTHDGFAMAMVSTTEFRRNLAKRVGLVSGGATVAQAQPTVDALAHQTARQLLVTKWAAASSVTSCHDTIAPVFAPAGSLECWVKVLYHRFSLTATSTDFQHAQGNGNTVAGRTKTATPIVSNETEVEGLVQAAYQAYFRRAADPSGLAYWTKKIRGGAREEGVEARLLGSPEFARISNIGPATR